MRVRILTPTNYEPTSDDSPRCWGQLSRRASEGSDGKCGPMVSFFRAGATPDLPDEKAAQFIASGMAEQVTDHEPVSYVSGDVIRGQLADNQ